VEAMQPSLLEINQVVNEYWLFQKIHDGARKIDQSKFCIQVLNPSSLVAFQPSLIEIVQAVNED
jgi:hypothetical protein